MRIYVPLEPDEFVRLRTLALEEKRTPQLQAALLIVRSLRDQERRTSARREGAADAQP